ncbi:MAG: hypothetical protein ACJ8MO_37815 [Bacillus sp. (in: firmicutes)]
MFILQVLFLLSGSGLAAVKKKPKTAPSLAAGILLLTYMLSIAIDLNEDIKSMKYFTPFKYFDAKNVMFGGELEAIFIILSVILTGALLLVTFSFYRKI